MSTITDTKCSACGKWQIKLTFCPYCGHRHRDDGYYQKEGSTKIYVKELKFGELPPIIRFEEKK